MQVHMNMKSGKEAVLKLTVREHENFTLTYGNLALLESSAPGALRELAKNAREALEKLLAAVPVPVKKTKAEAPAAPPSEPVPPSDPPKAEAPAPTPAKKGRPSRDERGNELPQQEMPF